MGQTARPRRLLPVLLISPVLAVSVSPHALAAGPDNPWSERRVLVIAHAGGENEAPHSTPFAYKQAAANGAEVLEGDVRLAGDGTLVVHHDATVDATTNGTGRVDEKTYPELFALDHGYKFTPYQWSCGACPEEDYVHRGVRDGLVPPPPGFAPEDFTIPTARYLFETFPDHFLDLEIKESGAEAQAAADALLALIEEFDAVDRTVVVSFDEATMAYVRAQLPGAQTSPGVDGLANWFLNPGVVLEDEILQVPPAFGGIQVVSPEFVERAHAEGHAVWVWMNGSDQENAEFYAELLAMGVDGLLVSRPSVARQVVDDAGLTWERPDPDDPDDLDDPDDADDPDDQTGAAGTAGAPGPVGPAPPVPAAPVAPATAREPSLTG